MLNDNVDVLRTRSSGGGVRGSMSSSSRTALGPRSCSGDGDGRGRMDPFRGGGDSTVICCGERSGCGGSEGINGMRASEGGGGNESSDSTGEKSPSSSDSASTSAPLGGAVATGVSPSRWRKSASGPKCAIRSQIGVAGMDVGISSGGSTGGGGVERPGGALRMRKRCLRDVVRGTVGSGAGVGVDTTGGGGGSGPVGGGLGATNSAGGIT